MSETVAAMLTSRLKLLLLMLASISVGILIAEGLLAILYFYQNEEWFYTKRNHSNPTYDAPMIMARPKPDGLPKRLHPFFGYVYEPNKSAFHGNARHNSFGFVYKSQTVVDMPYVPESNGDRIIGVLGGSVASNLVWAP